MNSLNKFMLIAYLMLACVLCNLSAVSAQDAPAQDVNTIFFKANEAYNRGKFQEAARLYETALQNIQNGYLYYNLGNCYFKLGKLGQSVLNYRRAQRLIPRFEDLISNLKYARRETKDKIEARSYSQVLKKIFFWYYLFSKKELIGVFLVLNFAFFLAAGIRIYSKADFARWCLILLSIFYLISGASALSRIYHERYSREGVVIAEEVPVRSANGINNVVLFKLHAGTEFLVREFKGDWLKIELLDGKKGWIQTRGAGII
jgi:tetratricopeptide (TPR) repeat protein